MTLGISLQAGKSRVRLLIDQGYLPGSKDGQCVKRTTLPASCAHFLEIREALTSCSPKAPSRPGFLLE